MSMHRQLPKNKFGDHDHQAALINAQQDAIYRNDAHEQEIKKQHIRQYRSELDAQMAMQKARLQEEREDERRLGLEFSQRYQAMREYEVHNSKQRKNLQQNFYDEYSNHQKQQQDFQRQKANQEKTEEQNRLNHAANARNQEEMEFKRRKQFQIEQENGVLAAAERAKQEKAQMNNVQKLRDQAMIQGQIDGFNKRDRDYRDYYNKVDQDIGNKMTAWKSVINKHQAQNMERASLDRQNQDEHLQRQNEKVACEEALRQAIADQNKHILLDQIQEKANTRKRQMEDFQREKDEMYQKVKYNEEYDRRCKEANKNQKSEYLQRLDAQVGMNDAQNIYNHKMTKNERNLNKSLITFYKKDEPTDFTGVPGWHPRVSPLKSSLYGRQAVRLNRSTETIIPENTGNSPAHGTFDTAFSHRSNSMNPMNLSNPSSPHESASQVTSPRSGHGHLVRQEISRDRTAKEFQYGLDKARHNPIVHPIGEVVPKPYGNEGLIRGKGSLLAAGARIVN